MRDKVVKKKGIGEEQEGVFAHGNRLEKQNIEDLKKLLQSGWSAARRVGLNGLVAI